MEKAKARLMAGEQMGGADVAEYVMTLGIAIGLGTILVVFRDQIANVIEQAGEGLSTLFGNITGGLS